MTRGRCPNFRIAIKKLRGWEKHLNSKPNHVLYVKSHKPTKKCILSSELSWQPGKSTHAGFKRYKWSVLRDGKFAFFVKSLLIIQADLSVSGKMMRFICYAMLFVKNRILLTSSAVLQAWITFSVIRWRVWIQFTKAKPIAAKRLQVNCSFLASVRLSEFLVLILLSLAYSWLKWYDVLKSIFASPQRTGSETPQKHSTARKVNQTIPT